MKTQVTLCKRSLAPGSGAAGVPTPRSRVRCSTLYAVAAVLARVSSACSATFAGEAGFTLCCRIPWGRVYPDLGGSRSRPLALAASTGPARLPPHSRPTGVSCLQACRLGAGERRRSCQEVLNPAVPVPGKYDV